MKDTIEFKNPDVPISPSVFDAFELEFELTIPEVVKLFYCANNGGEPSHFIFRTEDHELIVNAVLPFVSNTTPHTAVYCYRSLVLSKKLVSRNFFPFAIDPGGEYFFVDCTSSEGPVVTFNSDMTEIEKVSDSFLQFWDGLV